MSLITCALAPQKATAPIKIRFKPGAARTAVLDSTIYQIVVHTEDFRSPTIIRYIAAFASCATVRLSENYSTDGDARAAANNGFAVVESDIALQIVQHLIHDDQAEQLV